MKNTRYFICSFLIIIAFQKNVRALNVFKPGTNFSVQQQIPADFFIRQAAFSLMKAYQTSGIVLNGTSDEKIKEYARIIIDEHLATNSDLTTIAKAKNIVLPMSKPSGGQRPDERIDSAPENLRDTSRNQNAGAEAGNNSRPIKDKSQDGINAFTEKEITNSVNQLKNLTGSALDKAYINNTIADHKKAITLFEAGAKSNDPAIKDYASKYLPILKKHLLEITSISKR